MHERRGSAGGGGGCKPALEAAAAVAAALAIASVAGFLALVVVSQPSPELADEPEPLVVYDAPVEGIVPVYTQTDERWGGLPYAEADVATSGCGLTCAAMAWSFLSGEAWTPARLLNAVGNSCVQDGQNYMPGFCEWMAGQDPTLSYSVLYESPERALVECEAGRMVFASMSGSLAEGGREYGGHVVLLAGSDGEEVTVHDPCTAYAISLTRDEFQDVSWGYFISIGR